MSQVPSPQSSVFNLQMGQDSEVERWRDREGVVSERESHRRRRREAKGDFYSFSRHDNIRAWAVNQLQPHDNGGEIDALIKFLEPIQASYHDLLKHEGELDSILKDGQERANNIAQQTLNDINKRIGLQ